MRCIFVVMLALLFIAPAASQESRGPVGATSLAAKTPEKVLDEKHLHNVVRLHEKVLSGGQPYGDEGFKRLKDLGVRTIISVDGAKPDVALAKKYGMRYVHLPHGYDGIPEDRASELAKAVDELDGPIYIHCHHGKHRSPAAAAVACVKAGLIPPALALPVLETAGTSKNYRGLYDSANAARPASRTELDAIEVDYKEVAEIPAMADAMVEIEQRHDHLKQIAGNGWKPLPEHPDIAPAHEALMLREHITELLRTDEVREQPKEFRSLLAEAEQHARSVESAYRAWRTTNAAEDFTHLNAALDAVSKNCAACHTQFRDVPLSEKDAD